MTDTARRFQLACAQLEADLHILPDKPDETAAGTLKALWHLAAGSRLSLEAAAESELPALDVAGEHRLTDLIERRLSGVPLAYLTERQRFMGLDFLAANNALIPRVETAELLGKPVLALLQSIVAAGREPIVLDICTGSGNLALAIAHHVPTARVFASDISGDAIALAQRNASHLGLSNRVEFRTGDLLAPFDEPAFLGQVDLVVCAPPYISSAKVEQMAEEISGYEPRAAFDGGPLGVRILLRLAREAPPFLRSGGWLAFEVGAGQGPSVLKRMQARGDFAQDRVVADADGVVRAILAAR